jgi:hypothetical protein
MNRRMEETSKEEGTSIRNLKIVHHSFSLRRLGRKEMESHLWLGPHLQWDIFRGLEQKVIILLE